MTRKLIHHLIAAAAILALTAGAALAQDARERGGRAGRLLNLLDLDGDGRISEAEMRDEHTRRLGVADLDGNGMISPDEFRRRGHLLLAMRTTTIFDLLDANGDGNVTVDEMTAPAARWMTRYDKDGDGALSAEELAATSPRRNSDGHVRRRRR